MEIQMFELLERMEASWWYRARANVVRIALERTKGQRKAELALDAGSGFGGMSDVLFRASHRAYAWEPNVDAHEALGRRGYAGVFAEEEKALEHSYDLVGMFDVLEHIDDDHGFLSRLRDSLTDDGRIVLTVPAFPFLWSVHDELNHHYRRYTLNSLRDVFSKSGYEIGFISYWNSLFFLPAAFVRLLGRTGENALNLPTSLNKFLLAVVKIESSIMHAARLPFGTGLVAVARKAPASERCERNVKPLTDSSAKALQFGGATSPHRVQKRRQIQ